VLPQGHFRDIGQTLAGPDLTEEILPFGRSDDAIGGCEEGPNR
jgi:hypothetical protein